MDFCYVIEQIAWKGNDKDTIVHFASRFFITHDCFIFLNEMKIAWWLLTLCFP